MRSAAPAACAELAPDLARARRARRREHGVEHELARARRPVMRAGEHVLRAEPEHADDAREDEEDGDRRQHRARHRVAHRAAREGVLGGRGEARRRSRSRG